LSSSNETRKPTGRPSLLSAEQQNALEKHQPQAALAAPQAAPAPRRRPVWIVAGMSLAAIAAAFAVAQLSGPEQAATVVASVPATPAAPSGAAAPVQPGGGAAPALAAAAPPAATAPDAVPDTAPVAPAVAAIVDEAPPSIDAKPKESLAQMLESGVAPAAKPATPKAVRKPVKSKPAGPPDKAIAAAAPELDNDVELLAALVAHAKYDTSANARLPLPKALDQCKKQGKQDAARCRIRVCEGRWKKNECRAYNRSKLERVASGS
jgi:hypothetical protein